MTTSRTEPNDWMLKAGNEKLNQNVAAGPGGWERTNPDGTVELLNAMSGNLAGEIVVPTIVNITFQRKRNLSISLADEVVMKVNYIEAVTVQNGEVIDMVVVAPGEGYLPSQHGDPVTIEPPVGGGDNAVASLIVTEGDFIGGVVITDAGTGYTTVADHGAAVVIEDPVSGVTATGTLIVTADVVVGISLTERGSGYDGSELITIPAPIGGGDTATMDIVLGGVCGGIEITDEGNTYDGTEVATLPDPEGALPHTTATVTLSFNADDAPTIGFDENGAPVVAEYDPDQGDPTTLVFVYPVTTEGPIDNFDTALGGGATIKDADGNDADQDFPGDFAAPAMTVIA